MNAPNVHYVSPEADPWDLFAAARVTDPTTSHTAATSLDVRGTIHDILIALDAKGPATADQLCGWIDPNGRRWPTYKSALSRAIKAGFATPTGDTQLSLLGREQRIIAITDRGRAAL